MRLCCVVALACAGGVFAADPWADRVVSYQAGTGAAPGYSNPLVALGSPERITGEGFGFPGSVTPFNSAFGTDEIVSIGAGGWLTLAFDEPVVDDPANPFGIDLLVFGNAFFFDSLFAPVANLIADDGGIVEVSPDGIVWTTVPFVSADGLFPTLAFVDETQPFGGPGGTQPTDFTRPVDPAFNWLGTDLSQLIAGYNGSGGGAGVDIGALGLSSISYVRLSLPAGATGNIEIDAVSDVSAVPAPGAGAALVAALAGRARRRRDRLG